MQLKGGGGELSGSFCVQFLNRTHRKKAAGGETTGETKALNVDISVVLIA